MLKIERKSSKIIGALASAPVFKKHGSVEARLARVDEQVTTILANGSKETVNTAKKGYWLVTNPSGESYLIPPEKFFACYESLTNKNGIYQAKGYCRAIRNPFGEPIEIMASWGASQNGDKDCMIADVCDEEGKMEGEPYLIASGVFNETYSMFRQ